MWLDCVALLSQVALPQHIQLRPGHRQHWWAVLSVPDRDVYAVARELCDLHSLPKSQYVRLARASRLPAALLPGLATEVFPVTQQVADGDECAATLVGKADANGSANGAVPASQRGDPPEMREALNTGKGRPEIGATIAGSTEVRLASAQVSESVSSPLRTARANPPG